MKRNDKIPQYIQDTDSGYFGEVSEYDENTGIGFAYFINPETGWAGGSKGSVTFHKDDSDIKMFDSIMCAKLFVKLKEIQSRSNGMIKGRVRAYKDC